MNNKKKIFLRILKECGRIFFVAVSFLLFAYLIFTLCKVSSISVCHGCSKDMYCLNFTRKAICVSLLILAIVLIPLTYYKKISKMWIVAYICMPLWFFIAGQVVDYMTREPANYTLRDNLEVPLDKTN